MWGNDKDFPRAGKLEGSVLVAALREFSEPVPWKSLWKKLHLQSGVGGTGEADANLSHLHASDTVSQP